MNADNRELTLPDILAPGLTIVFVGINPGLLSAQRGRYFARRSNRFWPALSRSVLSLPIREALGREELGPEDDGQLLRFGIGFTDVVKRATRNAGELQAEEFSAGASLLLSKLRRFRPLVACFHGVTGFRPFARVALGLDGRTLQLGPQSSSLDGTRLYVVPSPSPANAHVRLSDQIQWYDRLAAYCESLHAAGHAASDG